MSSCFHGTCMYPLLFNFQIWPHNSSVQVFRYLSSLKNWYKWHNMLWVFLSFFPEEYWFSTPPLSDSPNSTVQYSICLQTQIILKVSRGILTVTNFLLRVSTKILTVKKPNKAILTMINCLLQISTALLISIFWCLHIWYLPILWVSTGVLCTITPFLRLITFTPSLIFMFLL